MPHRDKFIHLHTHTEYSLLDGACRIPDLLNRAKELGMSSLAVTDHGNMYAAVDFYLQAKEAGIKPIVGCEFYVAPRTRFDKETKEDRSPYHLTALAKNLAGYKNLLKLASQASLEGFYSRPRIDKELIEKHREGIIFLSGCPVGEIPTLLMAGKKEEALKVANWHREISGDDFYLEAMDLKLEDFKAVKPLLYSFSKETGIPLVATNDIHCVRREDAYAQDVLLCIQTNSFLEDEKRMKFNTEEFYLKSAAEMGELFSDFPSALQTPFEIAEKCNLTIETGVLHLPDFKVPEGETTESYLEKLVWDGIKNKFGTLLPPEVIDRVKYEIYTIEKMGYSAYFLIVQDFINWAKSQGIQVGPGRGSAAGSIVAYALGITNVNPLKYGLIFERFLNIERVTMPDIDIDFCFERRGEVIDYVSKKYGSDHMAQIVTFGTMAARGAIRDVGRVQKMPLSEVDKIAKLVPFGPDVTLKTALEGVKELKALYDNDPRVKALLDTAMKLEGTARHASVHAAGVVVSKDPLVEYVPLQKLDENQIVTQYTMEDLDKIGLLKMDFLGLRNLTMIAYAVETLKQAGKVDLDMNNLPLDDLPTYQLFTKGDTIGVFQLESRGMRALIKDLRPSHFDEIVALLALYRPGPLESGMVDDYVKRKHKQIPIRYELPELQPILKETYGVILYQEQVMEIASKIAGFSMGQADVLRAAMGKKKVKEMAMQKEFFIEGAVKRGISKHKAAELFNLCAKFAGYGFNKSHSTSYALISYQTAYLKANYPFEFMAALLTSVTGNTDKVTLYIAEARRMKIKILPPDINESNRNFTVTKDGIRFGIAAIKNVGTAAIDSIMEVKNTARPFASFYDFCRRVDTRTVNKKVMESLIKVGAFDSFSANRGYLLANFEKTLSKALSDRREEESGQESLFGGDFNRNQAAKPREETIPTDSETAGFSPEDLLRMEKELLGLYISSHPLARLGDSLEAQSDTHVSDIPDMNEGETVKLCGILSGCKRLVTRRGDPMLLAVIEDLTGLIPLVVFPKAYERCSQIAGDDQVVVVRGKLNRDFRTEELNVMVDSMEPLQEMEKIRSLRIELVDVNDRQVLTRMKELLGLHRGNDPVRIRMEGRSVELGRQNWVDINPDLVEQLEKMLGEGAVNVEYSVQKKNERERAGVKGNGIKV